jgi:hypothetical protein
VVAVEGADTMVEVEAALVVLILVEAAVELAS